MVDYIYKINLSTSIFVNITNLVQDVPTGIHAINKEDGSEYILSRFYNNEIILGFSGFQSSNTFTRISSFYSGKELACNLGNISLSTTIIDALKGTKLEIAPLSPIELEYCSYTHNDRDKAISQMQVVNELGQHNKKGEFLPKDAVNINQHYIGFTDYESDKPILGTFGAGPCIIVAFYNPTTKAASLSHLDGLGSIKIYKSIIQMITQINGDNNQIECHLRGGDERSYSLFYDILRTINKYSTVNIKSAEVIINREQYHSRDLAIDSRTGEIYTEFSPLQLTSSTYLLKSDEITIEFDGRNANLNLESCQTIGMNSSCLAEI